MINTKNNFTYFDKKSSNYNYSSHSFPWSIIRNLEAKIVVKLIGNIKDSCVFDIGCGSGFYTRLMIKNKAKKVYALDGSKKMLNNINLKNVVKINKNAEKFQLNKKFNKIICAGLLEFVNSPELVLQNIKKHALKDCRLVILCPSDNLLGKLYKFYHSRNNIEIKLFDIIKFAKTLKKTGWSIISSKYVLFSHVILVKSIYE